jgi:hypothetical protein
MGNAGRYPTVDESLDRLHRAGWSVGDIDTATEKPAPPRVRARKDSARPK